VWASSFPRSRTSATPELAAYELHEEGFRPDSPVPLYGEPGTFTGYRRGDPSSWTENLLGCVLEVASRRYTPRLYGQGNVSFQLTRGLLGVSMLGTLRGEDRLYRRVKSSLAPVSSGWGPA
jgi:hypothetical protein